jgi:hypothetical protein
MWLLHLSNVVAERRCRVCARLEGLRLSRIVHGEGGVVRSY